MVIGEEINFLKIFSLYCVRYVIAANGSSKIQNFQTSSNTGFKTQSCMDNLNFDISQGNTLVSQVSID